MNTETNCDVNQTLDHETAVSPDIRENNAPLCNGLEHRRSAEGRENPFQAPVAAEPATEKATPPNLPAKKSRKGCGCWAAAALAVLLILGSLGALFALVFSDFEKADYSVISKGESLNYHLLGSTADTKVKSKIVVLPIEGVISPVASEGVGDFCSPDSLEAALDFIAQDEDVVALVLCVNSPGGGLTASDVMYHQLTKFKKQAKIPVYAFFEDAACSGGYYISMAADKIYACPTTMTGSIGVIMTLPEISGLMNKAGVKVNAITSRNFEGKESYKDIGSMFRAMKPQEREILQNMITESWLRFVQVVADGRRGKLTEDQVKRLADGRIFSAKQAEKARIIDEICYADELYEKLIKEQIKKGNESPRAVMLKRNASLMDNFSLLGLRSWLRPLGSGLDVPQSAIPNRLLLSPVTGQIQ